MMNYVGYLYESIQSGALRATTIRDTYAPIGPDHLRTWVCELSLGESGGGESGGGEARSFKGTGGTKKEAKNHAARQACIALGLVPAEVDGQDGSQSNTLALTEKPTTESSLVRT